MIEQRYVQQNPKSQQLAARAKDLFPGGVSQTSRDFKPFPPYYERAAGTRKWTVDGQEIVDFCMGHGTLLFGHGHPEIQQAITDQLARGTHFVGPSRPEVELAELICELVPSAERVRFCGTGSEACDLAIRIARAVSGKPTFVRFDGHYHGWSAEHVRPSAGLPKRVEEGRITVPPNDLAALEKVLERDDIACVIVEPAGGTHGTVPATKAWVAGVRELTKRRGVILIFDEMVTGFRLAPGGYQAWAGVTPELTTLGKTLFGGLPGAAVAGRADLMDTLKVGVSPFVVHMGTWNAFPVACAAGVVALRLLRDGKVAQHINDFGTRIRARMNGVIAELGVEARVFGAGSHAHFLLKKWPFPTDDVPEGRHTEIAADPQLARMLRLALYNEGCDFDFANNFSALHTDADLERGVAGFAGALRQMLEDRLLTCAR